VINLTAVPTKNEDFDGYIPDMLKLISKHMNQPYTLHLVKSGSYGSQDSQGRWSGMIGEVHNNVSGRIYSKHSRIIIIKYFVYRHVFYGLAADRQEYCFTTDNYFFCYIFFLVYF